MVSGRSEAILVVTAVFLGISQVTVLLRFYVRIRIVRSFGADDWIMLVAMVSCAQTSTLIDQTMLIDRGFSTLDSEFAASLERRMAWDRRWPILPIVRITIGGQCW